MGKIELKIEIDSELMEHAAAVGLNVEALAERAVRLALQNADPVGTEARAAKWAEENAEGIKAHREQIKEHGVFGEDFRTW